MLADGTELKVHRIDIKRGWTVMIDSRALLLTGCEGVWAGTCPKWHQQQWLAAAVSEEVVTCRPSFLYT